MDDDLLDKVSYSESATPLTLTPLEEAVLLTMGQDVFSTTVLDKREWDFSLFNSIFILKSGPRAGHLFIEDVFPYINVGYSYCLYSKSRFSFQYILSQPLSWSIQFKALDMRSLLENTKSKLIERSIRQLEVEITRESGPKSFNFLRFRHWSNHLMTRHLTYF